LVALDGSRGTHYEGGGALAFFASDGTPLRTLILPRSVSGSRLAHNGDWLAFGSRWTPLFLLRLRDDALSHFAWTDEDERRVIPGFGFSPNGDELWVVHREPLELVRYRLP
jgi:hypothetical protein